MSNRLSEIHSYRTLKYILIVVLFTLVNFLFFFDIETTSNVTTKVIISWVNLEPTAKDPPSRMPASVPLSDTGEYVALCVAVKDQTKDLPEFFIHHYHHMGIRRFYIVDDGSTPPLAEFPDYGIPKEFITFRYWDPEDTKDIPMQHTFYNDCIEKWRANHTWMGFIDVDEYLDTPGPENLIEILKSFEADTSVGALGVNWRTHTSGGLLQRQPSNRKNFTTCIVDYESADGAQTDNLHVKSFVKTSLYINPESPHVFHTIDTITVGEHGDEIILPSPLRSPITRDRIGLHHYSTGSKEQYQEKMNRGSANKNHKGWDWWNHIEHDMPHVPCLEMTLYDP